MTHDLAPESRTGTTQPNLYRMRCACGWKSRWYTRRRNAQNAARNHQIVNQ